MALLGCGKERLYGPEDNPKSLRDVTGVEFGWSCDQQGCNVTRLAGTPPPDPCRNGNAADSAYANSWARFVEICSVCLGHEKGFYWSSTPGQCRLVACNTDANCPAIYESDPASAYACVDGLCQNTDSARFPRDTLNRYDVESLCFAVHPRANTVDPLAPTVMEIESTVAGACPSTDPTVGCPLPAGCRMP